MRLCVDCKKFRTPRGCLRPTGKVDPVHGGPAFALWDAMADRSLGVISARLTGACGREARFFEPLKEHQ